MKLQTPEGRVLTLRKVSDRDYRKAQKLSKEPLDVCPTCGGREEYIVPGVKQFLSKPYKLNGEEHECNCQLQMALRVRYLLAGIGPEFWPLAWENFQGDAEAKDAVTNYVDRWQANTKEGMGIMFSSPIQGVGKTWGAIHIGKEMIKQGQKVFFIDFPTMVNKLIREDTQVETESKMTQTTFLILDDIRIGISEAQTSLFANQFESVIRHRAMFNLPTIITTNLNASEFEVHFERIDSLLEPKQIWLTVGGSDYRRSQEVAETKAVRIQYEEVEPIV